LHGGAARLYKDAFALLPALGTDLQAGHRYQAARAAALAGCGRGKDAAGLDAKGRARWRGQALDWLRADLAAWAKVVQNGTPKARTGAQQVLRQWQHDPDLNGLRDARPPAELPRAEQQAWSRLWADVRALLEKAAAKGRS
jgi:serine/threonine-protein kinase